MSLTFSPSFSLRFLLPCSLSFPLWHYAFYISVFLSPASFNIPQPILVASFIRLLLSLDPLLASLTLCHRRPLASSLSLSLSFSACRESEKKGQNLAICLSLSVSAAALWVSLDIRGSARTGVRGNPAATRGVDRDDDDDDKLPAGKALRGTADTEREHVGETWGRVGDESLEEGRRRDERGSARRGSEGEATVSREGADVEESRQTRRQTRSGRRSTRTAAPENVVKRNRDGVTKGTEL